MVKNLPCNAGDVGSIPGPGSSRELDPTCHKATKPMRHNYRARAPWSLRATTREEKTHTPQLERSPCAVTKSPHTAMKDPTCLNEDPVCRS